MRYVVVGTAGHVDHGKSALVRALTGVDPDRLEEEKRRGITIDLGFAHLPLGDDRMAGIVDVPGHERFVRNMVAGATGIDLVLFVVAADEGVMPQTREHLAICALLGVQHGIVVLTKSDLTDEEWRMLVHDDLRSVLRGSFLDGAPIVETSTVDGGGLSELTQALCEAAARVPARPADGPLRLPVDRVFTMAGFGTVVTGTLASGTLREGAPVLLLPSGARGKVRGLQVHGSEVPQAVAGSRVAVNVAGVERAKVERGNVLVCEAGQGEAPPPVPTQMFDADVTILAHVERPLEEEGGSGVKLLLHAGTAQAMATLVPLGASEMAPAQTVAVQLRLDRPLLLLPGDRFLLRGFHSDPRHGATVGGGRVLDIAPPRRKRGQILRDPALGELLERLRSADPTEVVHAHVARAARSVTAAELSSGLPFGPGRIEQALSALCAGGRAHRMEREGQAAGAGAVVDAGVFTALGNGLCDVVRSYHREHPERPGISKEEVRSRLSRVDDRLFGHLIRELERTASLVVEGDVIRAPEHRAQLRGDGGAFAARVLEALRQGSLQVARPPELCASLGATPGAVGEAIRYLVAQGSLVRVGEDLYYPRETIEALKARLVAHLSRAGEISTQGFKELTGLSRKFLIPLQEHFDAERVTLRVGDKRVLRS